MSADVGTRPVYVVTFDPIFGTGVGGFDWYYEEPQAWAAYERRVAENTASEIWRIRLWNAFPVSTWDAAAITEYVDDTFVSDDPEVAPIRDSHPAGKVGVMFERGFLVEVVQTYFAEVPIDDGTADWEALTYPSPGLDQYICDNGVLLTEETGAVDGDQLSYRVVSVGTPVRPDVRSPLDGLL